VELLPDAEELDGVAVSKPVPDEVVRAISVFVSGDVSQADVSLCFSARMLTTIPWTSMVVLIGFFMG
jgi:hypothetical protein